MPPTVELGNWLVSELVSVSDRNANSICKISRPRQLSVSLGGLTDCAAPIGCVIPPFAHVAVLS
jgi:hypothetical protein